MKWRGIKSVICVKISNTPKAVIAIKSSIPDIGVIHNSNAYISEGIVYKHTSAKFDLVICKNEVNKNKHCSGYILMENRT